MILAFSNLSVLGCCAQLREQVFMQAYPCLRAVLQNVAGKETEADQQQYGSQQQIYKTDCINNRRASKQRAPLLLTGTFISTSH